MCKERYGGADTGRTPRGDDRGPTASRRFSATLMRSQLGPQWRCVHPAGRQRSRGCSTKAHNPATPYRDGLRAARPRWRLACDPMCCGDTDPGHPPARLHVSVVAHLGADSSRKQRPNAEPNGRQEWPLQCNRRFIPLILIDGLRCLPAAAVSRKPSIERPALYSEDLRAFWRWTMISTSLCACGLSLGPGMRLRPLGDLPARSASCSKPIVALI